MYRVMNSAMMPQEGQYTCVRITPDEFSKLMRNHAILSYIGYQTTADHIEQLSGVKVRVTRDQTTLDDGDVMLVCKLKYRLPDPTKKANPNFAPDPEDYEYFRIGYEAL